MNLTIKQAIEQVEKLKEKTSCDWYFKANKGTIKLVCGDYRGVGIKITPSHQLISDGKLQTLFD